LFENNKCKHAACKTQSSEQRTVSVTTCSWWSNNAVSAAPRISVCRDNISAQIHTDNPPNTNQKSFFFLFWYISLGFSKSQTREIHGPTQHFNVA